MPTRPPLTLHRLMRLTTWARVWLEMVARVLPVGGGLGPYIGWMAPELARRVACLRVMALNLIFLRADARVTWTKPKLAHVMTKFGPVSRTRAPCPAGLRLKILGARLRRLTRGKVLPAQIRALLQLLRDPEAEIARLARRLQRGLKRRVTIAIARADSGACAALTPPRPAPTRPNS